MESVSDPSLVGTVKMKLNLASDLHSHGGSVGPQVSLGRHCLRNEGAVAGTACWWPGVEHQAVSSAVSIVQTTSSMFHHLQEKKKQTNQTTRAKQ